jgi:diguanylate cyclase (GGDEF)-like protein
MMGAKPVKAEDRRAVNGVTSNAVKIASGHLVTTCATVAAIVMFVALGSQVMPGALFSPPAGVAQDGALHVAFILNVAIILFGWRRTKDLREALDAHEQAQRLAERNANTDPMTGLTNRAEFMRTVHETLQQRPRGGLLMLDLDHFKKVNDLHGHAVGDRLLQAIAQILMEECPSGSCIGRIGGDEFAILLPPNAAEDCEAVAQAILRRFAAPIALGETQAYASVSIGITELKRGQTPEDALRQSDVAMYAAKRAGRNQLAWFDSTLDRQIRDRVTLEDDIRTGIAASEFVPYFQPLINVSTGQLVGFEVLARWRSPKRGLLEAAAFIEVAEETGLIAPLSFAVMEQALREARNWPGHLKLAVNVSPVQFRDRQLAERLIKLLSETGFPARRLEIEITEGTLLEDTAVVVTILESLKNVGVGIVLDDFGTGYASLTQLQTLPFDRIKIDRSFVAALPLDEHSAAIVGTIATLGHSLRLPITAEGVESERVRFELEGLGCSEAQGWLFGRAVSAQTVRGYLQLGPNRTVSDDEFGATGRRSGNQATG